MATTFRDTLHSIVQRHIQVAVESATREALDAYRAMLAHELGGEARALPSSASPRAGKAATTGKRGPGFGAKMSALLKNRSCPVPGCKNKSRGPRYRFFCAPHADSLSQEEKERIIAESKGLAAPASGSAADGKSGKAKRRKRRKAR